ncbi:MAG: OmpA family protein [Saprospiraceae bacterium]
MGITVLLSNLRIIDLRIKIFALFVFLLSVTALSGQRTNSPPKISAKSSKELDDAVLAAATGNIDGPINTINDLIAKYPTWTLPRQQLSHIYYTAGKIHNAIKTLEASLAIDTLSQLQQVYTLGRMYEENSDFIHAVELYKMVISLGSDQPDLIKKAITNLNALESKRNLWQSEVKIAITPMAPDINTPNEEFLGRWTLDGKQMIFTRRLNHQDDLFIAQFDSTMNVTIQDFPYNTSSDEAAQTISPDGKYLIFTACDRKDGLGSCDLYVSVRKKDSWTTPINMGPNFNTASWESQPCFGQDGMSIYWSSSRPGGFGGRDIWMVRQLSSGNWSKATNAGPTINTPNNEASPFIHFDGRTMYFMRDGNEGLGGYDLYVSRMGLDGKWKTPENMKAPINSGADEGALSLNPDGKTAIITRMTDNQLNDLFEFQLPDEFLSPPVQALEVHVNDAETKNAVHARLEIFEVTGHDTIRSSQWSDDLGNITMSLERNTGYGLIASAEGYIMHSINLQPDTVAVKKLNIAMTPFTSAVDKTIALENIFFSTGSAILLPASDAELNKLYLTMRTNAGMKIEIRGHTDNEGTEEDNQRLSEARAMAVYQYLVSRGIDAGMISYKGFGESKPIATNDTSEGRKQNRRTEFYILKI